jgi:hypothetical protein
VCDAAALLWLALLKAVCLALHWSACEAQPWLQVLLAQPQLAAAVPLACCLGAVA